MALQVTNFVSDFDYDINNIFVFNNLKENLL